MRCPGSIILYLLFIRFQPLVAQESRVLIFHGRPELKAGVSIEQFALYYKNPEGDTTQRLIEVVHQSFTPASAIGETEVTNNRQMKRTSQVIWLQFQIQNTHLTDTTRLWYAGGPHAFTTLFLNNNGNLAFIGQGGICSVPRNQPLGPYALPLIIPPGTKHQYFVRLADYLLLLEGLTAEIHTTETFQAVLVEETQNIKWLFFTMSMIIGCILLMSLYSLYQHYLSKDKAYLYYAIYAALAFCWMIEFANPRFELGLAPASFPWLAHPWSFSFSHILSLLYSLFLTTLLNVPQQQPRLWRLIRSLMLLLGLLQVMVVVQLFTGLLIDNAILYYAIDALPALTMGVLMIIVTIRSMSKLKPWLLVGEVGLYVISLSPFHGVFLFNNLSPQVSAFINYPPFFISSGIFLELFCFSLALAYRNKLVEVERNTLQKDYTAKLESELTERTNQIIMQSHRLEEQHASQLKLAFDQKLAEMEMSALRAQMNPHFIFNCLNSIKLYTTDNDAIKASDYLTKFSKLIRLVLQNSKSERVTLENELEALQLYLEMEAMRFKGKLKYSIEISDEVDTEEIELPPMLLQPYVENAIWHGLMHKKEGGYVQIKIVQPNEDRINIVISDNGIGRTRAAELKSKSAVANKSFGMRMTGERITLINQVYRTNATVQVLDLKDDDGNAAGTQIKLDILV